MIGNLVKKRGDKAVKWTDFFPEHDPARARGRRMSDADIWRALLAPARAAGMVTNPKKKGG